MKPMKPIKFPPSPVNVGRVFVLVVFLPFLIHASVTVSIVGKGLYEVLSTTSCTRTYSLSVQSNKVCRTIQGSCTSASLTCYGPPDGPPPSDYPAFGCVPTYTSVVPSSFTIPEGERYSVPLMYIGTAVCPSSLPPLPCTDPMPVPDSRCIGGQGLWVYGLTSDYADKLFYDQIGYGFNSTMPYRITSSGEIIDWQCQPMEPPTGVWVGGMPQIFSGITCPFGFLEEPSSSSSGTLSSSSSSSSSDASVCDVYPDLPHCQHSSSSATEPSSSGSGQTADICDEFPTLPMCTCVLHPELPWCNNLPSSSSNSGNNPNSSSSAVPDLCTDFPNLSYCQSSSSVGSGSGVSGGSENSSNSTGNNTNGVNCTDMRNCDWARVDVQLTQLGVETETRNLVRDIAALAQSGYNLTNEQNILLHSVLTAVNSGSADVVNAINGLAEAVNASNGANEDKFNSALTNWQDMLNKTYGENGSKLDKMNDNLDSIKNGMDKKGLADSIVSGLEKFFGDTSGTGDFNSMLSEYGKGSGSAMGDSLGDGLGARAKIKKAVGIDSTSFKFLGNSSACPVYDLTFTVALSKGLSIGCKTNCKIDLCNVYGYNAGRIIRAFLWIVVSLGCLFMDLQILKTGGH